MKSETVPIERFRELVKTNEKHYNEIIKYDTELQKQIQWKLEACKKAEELQAKLTEIKEVLAWASENVWWCKNIGGWGVQPGKGDYTTSRTLYEALWSAWKSKPQ